MKNLKKEDISKNIKVHFNNVESHDSRFQEVEIWLMHLEENYNGSYFSKESVLDALDSLKNTPILGFVRDTYAGEDFAGHEMELVVEDGGFKIKYLGSAYGVIPESCNPRFKHREGTDGKIREYLVVDAIMWTKFDEAIKIINKEGKVSQSMELSDEFDGEWKDDGLFHFSDFKFDGACLLGEDVLPAMNGSTVEVVFSNNNINEKINRKLDEFYSTFSQKKKEVDSGMDLSKILEKYEISEEKLSELVQDYKDFSIEELDSKVEEAIKTTTEFEEGDEPEEEENKDEEVKDEEVAEDENNNADEDDESDEELNEENQDSEESDAEDNTFSKTFELSHDDIRSSIYGLLDEYGDMYVTEVFEDTFITYSYEENKHYKFSYRVVEEQVELVESLGEVFAEYLTQDEKNALEMLRANFESLQQENEELKEFKRKSLESEHEEKANELFESFDELEEEDVKEFKENVHNFTIEEIESKLYEVLGRKKASFTKKATEPSVQINVNAKGNDQGLDMISKIFEKHGFKPNNKK